MSEVENKVATETELKALAKTYLDAFDARDMARCMEFFTDASTVDFNTTVYTGKQAIEAWHKDRFDADLKMVNLKSVSVKGGDTVVVDGTVSSKRLAAWRIKALNGRVTMRFADGKIVAGKLSPRMTNPFNTLREDMGAW
jgi:hypothetical protein